MKRKLTCQGLALLVVVIALARTSLSQTSAPQITRIDPPSWWLGHSINPVRVLLHGANLRGATVRGTAGLQIDHVVVNGAGTYIFADVHIASNLKPGPRKLTVTTSGGST